MDRIEKVFRKYLTSIILSIIFCLQVVGLDFESSNYYMNNYLFDAQLYAKNTFVTENYLSYDINNFTPYIGFSQYQSLDKYQESDLDDIFAALADPIRRQMTKQLASGEKTLSQLAEPLDMSMPAVMKHVAVLSKSGIVRTEKRGRVRFCQLEPDRLLEAENWLRETARFWATRLESLDQYLRENP